MAYDPHWLIYIGSDFEARLRIQTRDSSNALADVDITGATFVCKLREARSSGTVIATPTVAIATAAAGKIDITIPNATSANLTEGNGEWDISMTLASEVTVIAAGTYQILDRMSR